MSEFRLSASASARRPRMSGDWIEEHLGGAFRDLAMPVLRPASARPPRPGAPRAARVAGSRRRRPSGTS